MKNKNIISCVFLSIILGFILGSLIVSSVVQKGIREGYYEKDGYFYDKEGIGNVSCKIKLKLCGEILNQSLQLNEECVINFGMCCANLTKQEVTNIVEK